MYKISKSFDFCYGHRVYTQKVNPEYAGSSECPCHRLHGHQGKVTIEMSLDKLDTRGFVIDFKELGFVKKFIDGCLDHRFILSEQDPNYLKIIGGYGSKCCSLHSIDIHGIKAAKMFDLHPFKEGDSFRDHLSSFVVVDFNPTSEALAEWIFNLVDNVIEKSPFKCSVDSVTWSETPKTQAIYTKH